MEFAKTVFGFKHPGGYSSKRVRGNSNHYPVVDHKQVAYSLVTDVC